ncbi:MAG: holo-[acyl-carrier-protein] synthase [Ignavibacteria bacterium]|nr:MAG: holo-[acyl-carrier-protein] synthase [Ignavibacteria bacterium]
MSSVYGIGVDIEEVQRFEELTGKWGTRFEERMYTKMEIEYCRGKTSPAQHFAARFAAKEAFAKAIGTGWTGAFRWRDVEVRNDDAGKPHFILHNSLEEQFGQLNVHLSLSHTRAYVTAMVVIQNSGE